MSKIEIREIEKFETTAFDIRNLMYDFSVMTGLASPLMTVASQMFSLINYFAKYFIPAPGKTTPTVFWYPIF